MIKKLVALDLLNTILSKVYTKITNETNEKIELATKGYADDAFIPLTQKAVANGVATLDANGHVPIEQIVDTTDETGDEFNYLSINDTGIELKSRVHNDYTNANPNNLIDSDTLKNYNGQWITGEPEPTGRMIPPYSIVFEGKEYSDIPDNEWKVLFSDPMDFSTKPELDKTMAAMVKVSDYGQTKQEKHTYYKELDGDTDWGTFLINRGWTKTTDGSATVYTAPYKGEAEHYEYTEHVTVLNYLLSKGDPLVTVVSPDVPRYFESIGFTPTQYSISNIEFVVIYSMPDGYYVKDDITGEYKAVKYVWSVEMFDSNTTGDLILLDSEKNILQTTSNETVYYTRELVPGGSTDDGWIEVLYGHKDGESNYSLINKIRVESDNTFLAYYNNTFITSYPSSCIYRYLEVSTSVQVTGTVEMTPATTVNPITKLGVIDEGTWVAGDVTTPNLKVNDSTELNKTTTINDDLHITEKVLDFGGTNYDVWDYANDNMNWVEE